MRVEADDYIIRMDTVAAVYDRQAIPQIGALPAVIEVLRVTLRNACFPVATSVLVEIFFLARALIW